MALLLKAGSVWVNAHNLFDAAAGFGGYKQSGYGRDGGKEVMFCHLHSYDKKVCSVTKYNRKTSRMTHTEKVYHE